VTSVGKRRKVGQAIKSVKVSPPTTKRHGPKAQDASAAAAQCRRPPVQTAFRLGRGGIGYSRSIHRLAAASGQRRRGLSR
jgi:hypothetical protein